jgi:hypothetical protein
MSAKSRTNDIRFYAARLLLLAVTGIVMGLNTSPLPATTNACWFESDTLKLEKTIILPRELESEFIDYLRREVTEGLSRSEVESDARLYLIFQNVEAGILGVTIEHSKPEHTFSAKVEACDFKRDWKPYWRYVEGKIKAFSPSVKLK